MSKLLEATKIISKLLKVTKFKATEAILKLLMLLQSY